MSGPNKNDEGAWDDDGCCGVICAATAAGPSAPDTKADLPPDCCCVAAATSPMDAKYSFDIHALAASFVSNARRSGGEALAGFDTVVLAP